MSSDEFDNYLALMCGLLRLSKEQREAIAGELRDHLQAHVRDLVCRGMPRDDAIRRALEDLGDAATLAASFRAVSGWRRRRLAMRIAIGSLTGALMIAVGLMFWQPQAHRGGAAVAQNTGTPGGASGGSLAGGAGSFAEGEENARVRSRLSQPVDMSFEEMSLQDVLEFVQTTFGVQVYVDQNSIQQTGVDLSTPVRFKLNAIPLEMGLDLIFKQLGLGYQLRSGVLIVASKETIDSQMEIRVYPVESGQESTEELVALIQRVVSPSSWSDSGGEACVVPYHNSIVVRQTAQSQEQVLRLLADLAAVRGAEPHAAGLTPGAK